MDLGDGVTDVLRSGNRFECYFGDWRDGWDPRRTRFVERKPRRLPGMSTSPIPTQVGRGHVGRWAQDIVLVSLTQGRILANLGFGDFGSRITIRNNA